ncbi:thermonuclease family protein [Aliiroseovarius sp.]|uniref:thermonuclease family protein n=1 Tax=Aliiroseovarius sp. TaxID=1872442 RepID=UPI003BAABCDC
MPKCGSGERYTCVVDGDTIWLRGEKIRLMGFDTPEPQTNICGGERERRLARKASARLVELLSENQFSVERHGADKYGRTLAVIRVRGRNVGEILIEEGLARRYPDGPEFWCR